MRVLHIDTGPTMRGGQYQALFLLDAQAASGCETTLLAGDGIRSVRHAARATWRAVRRQSRRCDLIHAHDGRAHSLAVLYGTGRPVVVARRVAFPVRRGIASQWKYRKAGHFIAVSEHVAGILRSGGVPAHKITVVHDAAPVVEVARIRQRAEHREPDRPVSDFCVVSANLDDPLKGRDLAAAACRHAGAKLLLSDDLQRDLAQADALLYLTQTEGLGSALLLAMSMGVPVIASAVGGIPEIVSNGRTGLLVDNTVESASRAILKLHNDPELRAGMANEALGKTQSHFSIERMAERTMHAYRHVLARTG